MAESLVSAFVTPALGKLSSSIVTEFESLWGLEKDLQKLSSVLSSIESVLQDAEEKQIHSRQVRDWMRKLKDAAYDAEDVLDDFSTEVLRSKVEAENQTSKWKQVWDFCFSCFGLKSLLLRCEITHKIKEINERLDEIAKERNNLHLREGDGGRSRWKRPETISLIHESDVFGRENDKNNLIDLLVSDGSVTNELSVIPIVGMGGLGKTTLAQLIYNDERVEKHFDMRAWVCVTEDFDVKRLSKAIIENTSKQLSNYKELTSLVERIQKIVSGQKFLLVLDDVWNEDFHQWELLRAPLRFGAKGSKIIVTTRSKEVSRVMGTIDGYPLGTLSDGDCWLLMRKRAFPNGDWDEHRDLVVIGKEIAKKCKGLPLAAKSLGGLLQGRREEKKWKEILDSEIWKLSQGREDNILAPLRLSYLHLPSQIKQCFMYCSIFPKDHEFEKDKLVKLWMAEGFITFEVGEREIEDVGCEYFEELLWRSFFQCEKDEYGNLTYKMHDLIHDLAQSVSEGECFRMDGDKVFNFSKKARYSLSFPRTEIDPEIFKQVLTCERLHTLLGAKIEIVPAPNNLFQQLIYLHVLELHLGNGIKELPDSIGNLKRLRYLVLSSENFKRLPESTSKLFNLQTLDVQWCDRFVELPKNTQNLINLRHLIVRNDFDCPIITPKGIGRLTCLRTLSDFTVGKESGCEIGQLMRLINLRGQLHVSGLQNVVNAKEDVLKNKQYIEELCLSWKYDNDDDRDASVAEEILERLQPHPNLRKLSIWSYNGERFPGWIGDPSFSKLVNVQLWDCESCQTFPPLWLLPSLKILTIGEMAKVSYVFCADGIMITKPAFPSLEELSMETLPDLVEWGGGAKEDDFPCLRKLVIMDCESLIALPRFMTSLCELYLKECNESILSSLSYLTSLSSLEIESFENLKIIPSGTFMNLKMLKRLSISWCHELVSLVEDDDEDWKDLHSLESLHISGCPQLMVLPDGMKNLISLKHLEITECKRLATLPEEGLPTMLQSLNISRCPLLTQQCQKESGEDWPKISHIPNIRFCDSTIAGFSDDDTSTRDDASDSQ